MGDIISHNRDLIDQHTSYLGTIIEKMNINSTRIAALRDALLNDGDFMGEGAGSFLLKMKEVDSKLTTYQDTLTRTNAAALKAKDLLHTTDQNGKTAFDGIGV